jgi:septum formation protein
MIAGQMKNNHQLLLASLSPRRRELLELLGLPFDVTTPNVPEEPKENERAVELAIRLSQAKAHAAFVDQAHLNRGKTIKNHRIILACDTVVALDDQILGKPRDAEEATEMLCRLREGPSHTVYSGITVFQPGSDRVLTAVAETRVTMRPYSDTEIRAYVASCDPLDKAGAYAIQNSAFRPVAQLQGCYANVMGLPLCHVTRCLRNLGVHPSRDVPTACQTHNARHCPVHAQILNGL